MQKLGMGISLLLFAVVLALTTSGMEAVALLVSVVGLAFSASGFCGEEKLRADR